MNYRKKINGIKYKFIISCKKIDNNFGFSIEAISKKSKTHSFINNLNVILSNFNIGVNDKRVLESQWVVKEDQAKFYLSKSTNFLKDQIFRTYLEKQLNLDRELGEWNPLTKQRIEK